MIRANYVVPVLRMFGVAKTKEFYNEFLGFKIDWEHRFSDDLPLYLQVSFGDIKLHLSEHHGDATPGAKIFIFVADISSFQRELISKEYRFSRPSLIQEPWGDITMTVYDPSSNKLVFAEPR